MTPEKATPELALASAYLDGDVTPVERAQVEASPELQALVATLRDVAVAIAAVAAPQAVVRDTAIASALAEFDGIHNSNVVSLANRRWPKAVLTAVAAVVLVGAVGLAAFNGGSDDKSSADTAAETKLGDASTEDAINAAVPTNAGGQVFASMEAPIIIDNPEQLRNLMLQQAPSADTIPVAETTAGAGDAGSDDTSSNDTGSNDEADRLASFTAEALACLTDEQMFLANIYYQGTLAIAVRDTVTGVTEAIDDTCTVLVRVNP